MSENLEKVPSLKRDASVEVVLNYNDAGAIAQAIIIITNNWKKYCPEKIELFKKQLEEKTPFTDIEYHCYMILDLLYRRILKTAVDSNQADFIDVKEAFNPLS